MFQKLQHIRSLLRYLVSQQTILNLSVSIPMDNTRPNEIYPACSLILPNTNRACDIAAGDCTY